MYTEFYGLRELPFELNPNPKYLLLTARHREALANLQYGISARKSLTLLLGEAGTGKTTLVHAALQAESCRSARILHLANPVLTRAEFVEFLARAFELPPDASLSKTLMLAGIERALLEQSARGITTALVIDEAQSMPDELLEEVRLLANIETPSEKLLPLVLAGQPELATRLNEFSLRQLKQRVALRCSLEVLDLLETSAYINGRIRMAGGAAGEIFTRESISKIYERSGGVPRTISVIADNAMVTGFAEGVKPIGPDIIRAVCDEFELRPGRGPARQGAAGAPPKRGGSAPPETETVPRSNGSGFFAGISRKRGFSFF